jgi:serine protease
MGPITLAFPTMTQVQSPVLVAPDGINVDAAGTYFQVSLFPDGNFYGTSAAAPNAAGVVALIRGAFPTLTATQLVESLKAGAVQLGSLLPDGAYGYGRVDAMGTLATFPSPTMTTLPDSSVAAGTVSAAIPFTVTGFAPLHLTVTSSNAALIPASGVSISPADCGTTTLTCSATVMVANGVSDTVTVTLAVRDGANRAASSAMKITVAGNQAAAPPATDSNPPVASSRSGGGGGALDWVTLAGLALVGASGLRRRS